MPGRRAPSLNRAPARRWTPEDDAQLRALHAQGNLSLRATAAKMGRAFQSVSMRSKKLGLAWDRGQTAAAAEAQRQDAAAKRTKLMVAIIDDAVRLHEQMFAPITYWAHGGVEYIRRDVEAKEPLPADKLKLAQAIGALIDRSIKIDSYDNTGGIEAGKSLLADLAAKLGINTALPGAARREDTDDH